MPTTKKDVIDPRPVPAFHLGPYSKLIAALAGNVVAIGIAWLAVQFPSIATCTVGPDGTDACVVFGMFTQAQITGALMLVFNSFFVWQAPPNVPST